MEATKYKIGDILKLKESGGIIGQVVKIPDYRSHYYQISQHPQEYKQNRNQGKTWYGDLYDFVIPTDAEKMQFILEELS